MTDDKLSPPDDGDVDPSGENLAAELSDPGDFEIAPDEVEAEELENADDSIDETLFEGDPEDMVVDDPEQLAEAEGLAAKARSSRPVKRSAQADDVASSGSRRKRVKAEAAAEAGADDTTAAKKEKSASASSSTKAGAKSGGKTTVTRKRPTSSSPVRKRTTPAQFVGQSVGELRKVNWPTGDQLRQYFIVVLVFVVLIITFVGLLDLAFGWGLLKLLGNPAPTPPQ